MLQRSSHTHPQLKKCWEHRVAHCTGNLLRRLSSPPFCLLDTAVASFFNPILVMIADPCALDTDGLWSIIPPGQGCPHRPYSFGASDFSILKLSHQFTAPAAALLPTWFLPLLRPVSKGREAVAQIWPWFPTAVGWIVFPQIHVYLDSKHGALFWMRSYWTRVGPKSNDWCP